MPIENERKYLLPRDFDPAHLKGWQRHEIRQAYLSDGPRIRSIGTERLFTYKRWIPEVQELVEIETAISEEDFNLLWSQRVEALEKTRYAMRLHEGDWVVDFLYDEAGKVFVVLAEVELPRHQLEPLSLPEAIADHILHVVDFEDNRFTNRKLSEPTYAAALYQDVLKAPQEVPQATS